jgi:hypothetical protein
MISFGNNDVFSSMGDEIKTVVFVDSSVLHKQINKSSLTRIKNDSFSTKW